MVDSSASASNPILSRSCSVNEMALNPLRIGLFNQNSIFISGERNRMCPVASETAITESLFSHRKTSIEVNGRSQNLIIFTCFQEPFSFDDSMLLIERLKDDSWTDTLHKLSIKFRTFEAFPLQFSY